MAPRALWNGNLSFGLVHIPVGLYPAEDSDELDFQLVDKRDLAPVGYQTFNKKTGREIDRDQTAKAFELSNGKLVLMNDRDFERANLKATQTLEIVDFVNLEQVDRRYFDRPYYIAPLERGAKPYALLRAALEKSGRAGIARVVIRTREHLAAVYPLGKVIVANLLRWDHELRDPAKLDLPAARELSRNELAMALQLIEAMSGEWKPEKYKDEYRRDLLALIRRKAKAVKAGAEVEDEEPEAEEPLAEIVDLMALLEQSVENRGSSRRGTSASRKGRTRGAKASKTGSAGPKAGARARARSTRTKSTQTRSKARAAAARKSA
jgi:DNA end-binding protein Ku